MEISSLILSIQQTELLIEWNPLLVGGYIQIIKKYFTTWEEFNQIREKITNDAIRSTLLSLMVGSLVNQTQVIETYLLAMQKKGIVEAINTKVRKEFDPEQKKEIKIRIIDLPVRERMWIMARLKID